MVAIVHRALTTQIGDNVKRSIGLMSVFMLLLLLGFAISSGTVAQTTEQYISELALEQFKQTEEFAQMRVNIESQDSGVQYSPLAVSFVEVHDGWARLHLSSIPESFYDSEGTFQDLYFQGAVAKFDAQGWQIIFENTAEFEDLKSELPFWLQFLDNSESPLVLDDISVPALPWPLGETWRLNGGLHNPTLGLDFGTLPQGDAMPIHAVDMGTIIFIDDTCLVTRRPSDGLKVFYQHVDIPTDSEGLPVFSEGDVLKMNELIGNTITHNTVRCGGVSGGHHVHFSFLQPGGDNIGTAFSTSEYDGSSLNGWVIDHQSQGTSMTRTYADGSTQTVQPNAGAGSTLNNRLFNSGCIANHAVNQSGPPLIIYQGKNCVDQVWYTYQVGQLIDITSLSPNSLNLRDGYSVIVYKSPNLAACYSGDLWDMTRDYYPGSSQSIANNIESVKLLEGNCGEISDPICSTVQYIANKADRSDLTAGLCENASPPPPNTLPLPPGPQGESGGGVKLYQYPNYEGELLYTFNEGYSNEPNAEGYSLQIPSGWSVITYRGDNHTGLSRCWNGNVDNLQDHDDWQTKIQSLQIYRNFNACATQPPSAPEQYVRLWNDINYSGWVGTYGVGFHDDRDQSAESVQIPAGWSIFVYQGHGREIRSQCFNTNVPNFSDAGGWDNKIVGLEVYDVDYCQGTPHGFDAVVFVDDGFHGLNYGRNGFSATDNVLPTDFDGKISSIYVKPGKSVRVFQQQFFDFESGYKCFTTSQPTMRSIAFDHTNAQIGMNPPNSQGWDSNIRSFLVYDNDHCEASPKMPRSAWGFANDDGSLALGSFVMSAEANNDQSITVSWEATADSTANGYHIYEHVDNDAYELVATINSRFTTSTTFNNLPCGTDFHYLVKAFNQWGDSATPNLVAVSTPSCFVEIIEVPDTLVYLPLVTVLAVPEGPTPNAPTNLRLTGSSESTLHVSWNDNSGIEQTFEVWYQVIGGTWYNPSVPANTTSYTISGLSCETGYFALVRAVRWENGFEYYADSNVLQPTTGSCGEGGIPNAPTNVRALDTTQTSITFGWDDNSSIETDYKLQIHARDASVVYNEYLPANTTSQLVAGLNCGEEYSANVQVWPINPSAIWTETLYVHTDWCGSEPDFPRRPTEFRISSETQTSITYAWEDNSSYETQYAVYWFETSQGDPMYVVGFPINSTSGTVSGLICGTRYSALVVAVIDDSNYESFWMWHDTAPCS